MRKSDYDRQYMKNNCRAYRLQLNKEKDKDIVDYLDRQENVNGTLKSLIRREMNGEMLPKGHGRLIDADAFIRFIKDVSKRQKYGEVLIDKNMTVEDVLNAVVESLENKGLAEGDTPTIVSADKDEEE